MGEISDALARARESGESQDPATSRERPPVRSPRTPTPTPTPAPGPESRPRRERIPGGSALARFEGAEVEQAGADATRASDEHDLGFELPSAVLAAVEERESIPIYRHEIPRDQDAGWASRVCAVNPGCATAVRFRHLAVRLRGMLDNSSHPSLLVTSALPGEGKTTVSVNLAIALASVAPDYRIALVDMDLRRGRVANVLGFDTDQGIERVLAGDLPLESARVRTEMSALDFFPLGRSVADAHRLLGAAAGRLFDELHREYDYVVCDGPPVLPVPDIPLISPHVGGCLAVAASGKTRHAAFREMMGLLPRGSVFGVFLNENPSADLGRDYSYYGDDPSEMEDDSREARKARKAAKARARAEAGSKAKAKAKGKAGGHR